MKELGDIDGHIKTRPVVVGSSPQPQKLALGASPLRGTPLLTRGKRVHPNNRASEVNQDVQIIREKGRGTRTSRHRNQDLATQRGLGRKEESEIRKELR